jgi:hypothetical protein
MLGKMAADPLHALSCAANRRAEKIPAELIVRDSSGPAPTEKG